MIDFDAEGEITHDTCHLAYIVFNPSHAFNIYCNESAQGVQFVGATHVPYATCAPDGHNILVR